MKPLLLTLLLLTSSLSFAGMGGGHPCPPFSPCWCQSHPNHPHCRNVPTPVPIDDYLWVLVVIGGILAYKTIKIK